MNRTSPSRRVYKKNSIGLKKYFASLTKEERSKIYDSGMKGINHPAYKPIGSVSISKHNGYNLVKISDSNWKSEHVLIVEAYLDRKLRKGETVHHINENRTDNRLENLYVFPKRGLHSSFTQLVKYNIIPLNILKSNLDELKAENGGI